MHENFHTTFLIMVYIFLVVVSGIATCLYWKAYIEMKRTPIIKSVLFLLFSILIENVYFCISSIAKLTDIAIYNFLMSPGLWVIPKIIMLVALIYFIMASLSENEYIPDKK